jgi:hypothetical protein
MTDDAQNKTTPISTPGLLVATPLTLNDRLNQATRMLKQFGDLARDDGTTTMALLRAMSDMGAVLRKLINERHTALAKHRKKR